MLPPWKSCDRDGEEEEDYDVWRLPAERWKGKAKRNDEGRRRGMRKPVNFGAPSLRRRLPWHDSKKAIFVPSLLHAFLAFSPSSDRAFGFFPRFILENEKSCAGRREQAMFAAIVSSSCFAHGA